MFFWNSVAFSLIQWMFAIWSLVSLPFLNPAWTSGSFQYTYCRSLTWRILSITLPACEMSAIVWWFEHSLALPFLGLEWKLTFSSPVATAEFSKFAGILSAATSPPGPVLVAGLRQACFPGPQLPSNMHIKGNTVFQSPCCSPFSYFVSVIKSYEMNSTNFPLFLFSLHLSSWTLAKNKECSYLVCLPSEKWSDVLS